MDTLNGFTLMKLKFKVATAEEQDEQQQGIIHTLGSRKVGETLPDTTCCW